MKITVTKNNTVYINKVRIGKSSCREGARNLATCHVNALTNYAHAELLETKIRRARQHAFTPGGDPMTHVDAYKREMLTRRQRVANCGIDLRALAPLVS